MNDSKTAKKLTGGIAVIVLLTVCLFITTLALVYETVEVKNNLFHTGSVELNLNDGEPVIQEHEFIFEPGMTVRKDFFIENNSTWSVFYKLYLDQIEGGLADVLDVTIQDGDKVLYTGTAKELTKQNVASVDDILQVKERKNLTIIFYYPGDKGNETQNLNLSFTLCAEGVQTKNNPDRKFD